MTPLPPALAAWAEPLSLFPPELALSLGSCVRRLAQAIGPLARPVEQRSDDPNGYEGLGRRGPYERLLISEWLLADEVPEEFLRRAAQGEHAFLTLSFRRPGGSRRSLALFDAGPELIGEPRVGQLAALVVLSQRARRDGVAFGWGVLQDDERRVSEEVTPSSILRLLFSRTARTANEADAEAWLAVEGAPLLADDLWVVGSARTLPIGGAPASRLELEDPLLPGRPDLIATIRRPRAAPLALELPLPARDDCVRLLRDPFSARKAAPPVRPPPSSPANGIAFAQNGRRLLVRHRDGNVSAHPVPNSPRMAPGIVRTFLLQDDEALVAAGWMRGGRAVLVRSPHGFCLQGLQRQLEPPVYRLDDSRVTLTSSTAPAPLATLLQVPFSAVGTNRTGFTHVFTDAEGQLFALGEEPERLIALKMVDVLACAERNGDLHVIHAQVSEGRHWVSHSVNGQDVNSLSCAPGLRAFLGGEAPWAGIEQELGRWAVLCDGPRARRYRLVAPSGAEVFGVATAGKTKGLPGLLIVEPDRRSTSLIGFGGQLSFPRTRSPIVAAVGSGAGNLATLEADGTVTVVSLEHESKVLELLPPEPAEEEPS